MNLTLSIIALALGPLLYVVFQKSKLVWSSLDGFLFITIAGIVVVHIIPDVFHTIGNAVVPFILAGAVFAFAIDRSASGRVGRGSRWIVLVGAFGLILHALMDGIALLPPQVIPVFGKAALHDHGAATLLENHLALGVILHRIPMGMAVWWAIQPRLGAGLASAALAVMAAATAVGYLLGDTVVEIMQTPGVGYFQGFIAGTLLHVIIFSSLQSGKAQLDLPYVRHIVGERLGVVAGLFLVFLVPHAH